jgi:hypothetical protein
VKESEDSSRVCEKVCSNNFFVSFKNNEIQSEK